MKAFMTKEPKKDIRIIFILIIKTFNNYIVMPIVNKDNKHKWIKIRSLNYKEIKIYRKSKDDNYITQCPNNCPICFNIIWNSDKKFMCKRCKMSICILCMDRVKEYSFLNKVNYSCPYCRTVIETYVDCDYSSHRVNINTNNNINTNARANANAMAFGMHDYIFSMFLSHYINQLIMGICFCTILLIAFIVFVNFYL